MSPIHPTAIVDPAAQIDPTAEIGPYVIIEGPVVVGARTRVRAHAHLSGRTVIGTDNDIHMGAILGHDPQHLAYKGADSGLRIGNGNIFREYTTVHRAYHPGHETVIGDNNFLMAGSHVGHDARLGNEIVLVNGSLVGGHVQIDDKANISGNVAIHQFVRIGRLVMVGGNARVVKDVPPFMMVEGNSEVHGLNTVGLRRAGYAPATREMVKRAYRVLYRSGFNVPQALEKLEDDAAMREEEPVRLMIDFIRGSVRGLCRHAVTERLLKLAQEREKDTENP